MSSGNYTNIPVEDSAFTVIDVETTGLSATKNKVIEIGMVRVEKMKIVSRFQSLINPQTYIPGFISQFTGISNDDVSDAPLFEDLADEILSFTENSILTAHNLPFDYSFLKNEFKLCGYETPQFQTLCTLKLSRRIFPFLKSRSLGSVAMHLKIKNSDAHRALADAETTARILIKLTKQLKKENNISSLQNLLDYQSNIGTRPILKIKKDLVDDVGSVPDAPGIYYFLNKKNEIIYVGKAKSLRERMKSYFSVSAQRKPKKIVKQASRLKIEITNSELTALLLEAELIKKINPKHNTQLKSYGNKYFLRINTTHKVPDLEITNYFDFDGNDYFGLFTTKKKTKLLFDVLAKTFEVRECNDKELAKGKGCFLKDIERCTAPCLSDPNNMIRYKEELNHVYEFLGGKNQTALNRLLNKMKLHSTQQKYEKAAEVKELLDLILAQVHKNSLLAEPINNAKVVFEIDSDWGKDYLLMLEGKIFIKKYLLDKKDYFDEVLDDYFNCTIQNDMLPSEEDLEKMKISLNWLIKNRNKVRTFYLKDYSTKHELYLALSSYITSQHAPSETTFEVSSLLNQI
ncbi:MAG: GIY-YIG nuclease family protein [Ignavibacteriaceae bacterium]|nr:GIY-YIG nuclease family protein [Ignavibacteriaceae bacterium]